MSEGTAILFGLTAFVQECKDTKVAVTLF